MKPKLLLGLALVLSDALFGCSSNGHVSVESVKIVTWPDREAQGPAWPRPMESMNIINERFAHGSTNVLGNDGDIAAIQGVITTHQPSQSLHVAELRWLSKTLVMARVRAMEAEYYYVVEQKNGRWKVLTYYLIWIS